MVDPIYRAIASQALDLDTRAEVWRPARDSLLAISFCAEKGGDPVQIQ